jgi:hypothetical protein
LEPDGTPVGWSTPESSGATMSTESHDGKRAAKTWIYSYYEPGSWISFVEVGQNAEGEPTTAPNQLSGFYMYDGEKAECEKGTISLMIGRRTGEGMLDTISFGATELKLTKQYKPFELSIKDAGGEGAPEFFSIHFYSAGRCNTHGGSNCCFLYVDDIKLGHEQAVIPAEKPEKEPKKKKGDEAPVDSTAVNGNLGEKGSTADSVATDAIEKAIEKANSEDVKPTESLDEEGTVEEGSEENTENAIEEGSEEGATPTEGTEEGGEEKATEGTEEGGEEKATEGTEEGGEEAAEEPKSEDEWGTEESSSEDGGE